METVFVIVGIIALFIYLIAQDSKKETAKERYGEGNVHIVNVRNQIPSEIK